MVSCGSFHTLALDLDGNVWSFGLNNDGQLGIGQYYDRFIYPKQVDIGERCKYISCGGNSSYVIDINDNIWVFGNNSNGQLRSRKGLISTTGIEILNETDRYIYIPTLMESLLLPTIKSISCGYNYAILSDINEKIWGLGGNDEKQLGIKTEEVSTYIPIEIKLDDVHKIKKIACGYSHTIVLADY